MKKKKGQREDKCENNAEIKERGSIKRERERKKKQELPAKISK